MLVLFQIFFTIALNSSLACSRFPACTRTGISRKKYFHNIITQSGCKTQPKVSVISQDVSYLRTDMCFTGVVLHVLPSVLILSAVRTKANSVALNITVPSLFRGMFIDTRRWGEISMVMESAFTVLLRLIKSS